MTCFYCGTELPTGAMFCGECGRPVNTKGGRSTKAARAAAAAASAVPVAPTGAEAVAAEPQPVPEPLVQPAAVAAPVEPEPVVHEPVVQAVAVVEPVAEPEPVAAVEPEPEPEPEPQPEPVAIAEPKPEPIPEPVAQVAADPLPEIEPDLEPEPEPEPAPHDAVEVTQRCAQCGAPLGASDIFCPECGFVRQRESSLARPADTNILDPFPWGLPRSTEPVANHVHVPVATDVAPKPFAEIADVSETRLVPRGPRGERFVLQFSTGESVSVSGTGLIGRNPVAEPGEYFDTLVAVIDPGRSVSKTHLEFGQDDTSFWVSDRYSGNGTVVREPDREPRRCDAGKRYRVARGARVEIGEQFFIVS